MIRRGVYLELAVPLLLAGHAACVLFSDRTVAGVDDDDDDDGPSLTVSSAVRGCLSGVDPFVPCVNERAMAAIELAETMDSVRLDPGLEISGRRDDQASVPRAVYSFGDNPYNVGAVVEAASSLLSRRTFCWDIGALYPGLQMRIGPTYNGKGIIDFYIDSRRKFDERSLSYGQMIFKRSLLPNVLATQISIASVIPLMFAAIYFLTKKAFILSKIALIVTSVVGYGSLFLHHSHKPFGHSFAGHHVPTFGHQPTVAADAGLHHIGGGGGGGHPGAFVGDIRGDKYYGHFDGFQQISSSRPGSLFRGVNYFPEDGADAAYRDAADRHQKQTERT